MTSSDNKGRAPFTQDCSEIGLLLIFLLLIVDCEYCESNPNPATQWCEKCDLSICTDCCYIVHEPRTFSKHQRIPIDQKPLPPVLCTKHKTKKLKYHCKTDFKLLCQYCYDIDHKAHDLDTIEDASKSQENQVNRFARERTNFH